MLNEFRKFAARGNVVDMAVGIVLGGAFGTIAKSLVNDVLMPPIGMLLGNVNFENLFVVLQSPPGAPGAFATLADAQAAGAVTINYGVFVNSIVSFLIVAVAMFILVRAINQMHRQEAPVTTTKSCPRCAMTIPLAASRCPHCTSELQAAQ